jgi:hypothetical protein
LRKEQEEHGKTGAPEFNEEEGRALLARMKHISKLIADVYLFSKIFNLLFNRELSLF